MRTIQLICVGKLKESYLREACAEYSKRLGVFCRLQVIEVGECKVGSNPKPAEIQKVIETEGKEILGKIPQQSYVIAMCIEGQMASSMELARKLEQLSVDGISSVTFVIGGSYGLSQPVKERADWRLSMSPMTFPHQLARVMLLEQVYRGCSILANSKYHK